MANYDAITNGKWILDIRETESEIWMAESYHDTKEEAIKEGYYWAKKENLKFFRVGLCEDVPNFGIDVDRTIEDIQETMYEAVGEVAEDYLDHVDKEHLLELEEKLNEIFYTWQKEHDYEPSYFTIVEEETITI